MEEYKSIQKFLNKTKKEKIRNQKSPKNNYFFSIINKSLVCVIFLLIMLCIIKVNPSAKNFIKKNVYETNLSFATINSNYEKYFGSFYPSSKKNNKNTQMVFKEELVYSKKEDYKEGVKLTVGNNYLMPVLESGIIVYMGNKDNYGKTIIVQQVNGIDLWYVGIENTTLKLYDYVEKGSLIGESISSDIDLYYQKQGEFLNYKDYLG